VKTENTTPFATVTSTESLADSGKLVSLLALAAGAAAMPQSSHADIIYQNLSANPQRVGYAGGYGDAYQFTVPGTAQFGFKRQSQTGHTTLGSLTINYRTVVAGRLGGAVQAGVQGNLGWAAPQNFGAAWDQGLGLFYNVYVGTGNDLNHFPNSDYDHKYLAWAFVDTTQGNVTRYGWAEIGLSIGNYPGGPNVTIYGYAFDNTGLQPTMGQTAVPEPSSAGLMVLGALALGAKGLRSWRRNRAAADKA
jgi:hypothetical protein